MSYRLDIHLVLNAFNHLGMTVYQMTERELPILASLSNYIRVEHRQAMQSGPTAPQALTLADELERCRSMIELKAALTGATVEWVTVGDLRRSYDGPLGYALVLAVNDWMRAQGAAVHLKIDASASDLIVVSGRLDGAQALDDRGGGLQASLDRAIARGLLPERSFRVMVDRASNWTLLHHRGGGGAVLERGMEAEAASQRP
ncbi:MAG: hypothetical protein WA159_06640 [Variovorax sp.]